MARSICLACLSVCLTLAACNQREKLPASPDSGGEPSPNASILPAPLASGAESLPRPRAEEGPVGIPADSAGRLILPDASAPRPRALREDQEPARDTLTAKDGTGATLEAEFKWFDVPSAPAGAPISTEAMKRAREKTALKLSIDLASAGRMRLVFSSVAFPLPLNSELRARSDRFGHVLVWPDGNAYRLVTPGALRAMFAERRADVTPLVPAKTRKGAAGSLLGMPTTKSELSTGTGQLSLEQANLSGIGASGELLCRTLVELIAAEPSASACSSGLVPLRAEFRWTGGGRLGFEVSSLTRRQDLPIGFIFVPPASAMWKPGELPPQPSGVLLTLADLAELRTRAAPSDKPPREGAPGEGLTVVNHTDALAYVLLDGIPLAWVRPHGEQYVIGPKPGRYTLSWRDFFGVEIERPASTELPARILIGAERDAGPAKK